MKINQISIRNYWMELAVVILRIKVSTIINEVQDALNTFSKNFEPHRCQFEMNIERKKVNYLL